MFNRHQAEITVMQFRGYSLPVHDYNGTMKPSPCPISYALIRPRDLFRLLAVGMCHFLPVYYLGIAFLGLGRRSKYNTLSLPPGLIWLKVVILVRFSSICQIDLFKNYSYSIGSCVKILLRNNSTKNVNMNTIP